MAVLPSKRENTTDDLLCPNGKIDHDWDYIHSDVKQVPPQVALYKCKSCRFKITKSELKRLTDGGI